MTSRTTRPARDAANDAHRIAKPDLIELLRESGYRWTWRDELAELWSDIRDNPVLAMVCTGGGFIVGMLAVVVPAVVLAGVLS